MRTLQIGEKVAEIPVIQGGMGVGVSRSSLAGAVAKAGGIGIISTAQIGYDLEGFDRDQAGCNLEGIRYHIKRAKEIAGGKGLVGVNVMTALKHYREHVREAAKAGADVIICGAGLPADLPELVEGTDSKIAPIVSSARAAKLILKIWDHHYKRTADFVVIEGPKAGGHLGFSYEQLQDMDAIDMDTEIKKIIGVVKGYSDQFQKNIPVIVGGGVFDRTDVAHVFDLGAQGVQIASRFVTTKECDASEAFKQAYINAGSKDIQIVKSPVGMPGRAVRNAFVEHIETVKDPITKCYQCLEKCKPAQVPYCITQALINAVKGDLDHGLIFVGSNVDRIHSMTTVPELMKEIFSAE